MRKALSGKVPQVLILVDEEHLKKPIKANEIGPNLF